MRSVRWWPDGRTEESLLEDSDGAFRLQVRRPDGEEIDRRLPGASLAEALAQCPEITDLTAHDRLEIECDDVHKRGVLRGCFADREPEQELDDGIWPDGDNAFLWHDDDVDPEFEELLRLRWLVIDGEHHAVLALPGRTRVVAVSEGRVEPDRELISATWHSESAVTSFDGTYSVGLLGDDLLLKHSGGDMPEASITPVTTAEIPKQLAAWLADYNLAPAFLLDVTGLSGLTSAEAESIENDDAGRLQSLSSSLTDGMTRQVVEALRTIPGYGAFQDALIDPASAEGRALYTRFREVLAGEAELLDVLQDHV